MTMAAPRLTAIPDHEWINLGIRATQDLNTTDQGQYARDVQQLLRNITTLPPHVVAPIPDL